MNPVESAHLASERGVRGARNLDVIEVDGLGAHREPLSPLFRRQMCSCTHRVHNLTITWVHNLTSRGTGADNLDVIEVDGLGAHRERQLVPVARRALVVRRGVLEQVGPEG